MAKYKLSQDQGWIIDVNNGFVFYINGDPTDYNPKKDQYLQWLAEGNEPLPADQPETNK
jgi:hypothetical protein